MGYELDIKVKLDGLFSQYKGSEIEVKLTELCDDGGEPEVELHVPEKKDKNHASKLKATIKSDGTIAEIIAKSREILNSIRDQAWIWTT